MCIRDSLGSLKFYSLYGHLTDQKKSKLKVGDFIEKGEKIAEIGSVKENGGWSPHLHFQIMLTLLDYKNDFPGVCLESEKKVWSSICPNPNLILNIDVNTSTKFDEDELKISRKKYLPRNLKLSYNSPIYIVRGFNQYLYSNLLLQLKKNLNAKLIFLKTTSDELKKIICKIDIPECCIC